MLSLVAGQILAQQLRHGQLSGGNNPSLGPPKHQTMPLMDAKKKSKEELPTCPMVYAIITDMNAFDNPKVDNKHYNQYLPSYPADAPALPALVPLTLKKMKVKVKCHISMGFVTLKSAWDVNCVRSRTFCDCLLVSQGTVSSVEIDMGHGRFYTTTVVPRDEVASYGARGSPNAEVDDSGTYNPKFFGLNIPQVEGGSKLDLKVTLFEPMTFVNGLYSLRVPFVFLETTLSLATELSSITKIRCSINTETKDPIKAGNPKRG